MDGEVESKKKEWVGKRVRVKTCRRAFYGRDPKKNGFFIARTGEKEVGIFSGGSKGEQNKKLAIEATRVYTPQLAPSYWVVG